MQQLTLCLALLLFPLVLLAQEETPIAPDSSGMFKKVEEMPRFPGCDSPEMAVAEKQSCAERKMLEFIYRNVRYPELARQNGIEGVVVISFVVERNGVLTNVQIARDIGGGCGEESKRVVELMNTLPERWTPGKVGGEAVRVHFNLPVKFKLEGGGGKKKKGRKNRG